jgi:UDP-2,3-diacylglucosamine hydrolase
MATLFISDLHLSADRPALNTLFLAFLRHYPRRGDTLYILGDLFEAWLGDDAGLQDQHEIVAALRALSDGGTQIRFMHGNRDFLVGADFERATGCRILAEPALVAPGGETALLMHGDSLCTDDVEYQAFKARVRQPAFIQQFLALPVAQRRAIAQGYRAESAKSTRRKPMEIMDVNADAVANTLREHGVRRLIHGHTHRQAIHELLIDDQPAQRIVLGDWDDTGCVLVHDELGYRMENFDLAALTHQN